MLAFVGLSSGLASQPSPLKEITSTTSVSPSQRAVESPMWTSAAHAQALATLQIEIREDSAPVSDVTVVVSGTSYTAPASGVLPVNVSAGAIEITAVKEGFVPITTTVNIQAGETRQVLIELQRRPTVEEHITVSATRTDKRLEDQPMRVEVLAREEIEEKMLMRHFATPFAYNDAIWKKYGKNFSMPTAICGDVTSSTQPLRTRRIGRWPATAHST